MKLELLSPRVAAIDYGDLSTKRDPSEFREIKVEFDYDFLSINKENI